MKLLFLGRHLPNEANFQHRTHPRLLPRRRYSCNIAAHFVIRLGFFSGFAVQPPRVSALQVSSKCDTRFRKDIEGKIRPCGRSEFWPEERTVPVPGEDVDADRFRITAGVESDSHVQPVSSSNTLSGITL